MPHRRQPGLVLRMRRERRVTSSQHRPLDDFRVRLAAGRCDACRRPLEEPAFALADHEGREEGLLASLRTGGEAS